MATLRHDPLRGYNFVVSFVDSAALLLAISFGVAKPAAAGFSECSGLDTTLEVEDYREGGNNGAPRKFPTRVTWGTIKLKRGISLSDELFNWHQDFVLGSGKRRDGLIVLQDDQHQAVKTWSFRRGLPVKWTGPSLNAAQSQVAVEELEIAHEGLSLQSSTPLELFSFFG